MARSFCPSEDLLRLLGGLAAPGVSRLGGTLRGTGENAHKGEPVQSLAQLTRMLLPACIQRQVGSAGVLAGFGPGRVAVPGQEQSWQLA